MSSGRKTLVGRLERTLMVYKSLTLTVTTEIASSTRSKRGVQLCKNP
jgi:hypothetical protein